MSGQPSVFNADTLSIVDQSGSERGVDAATLTADLMRVTLRVLKHELRTPINHIIGYSEMLIEDLASDPAALAAMQVVLAAGKEMLAVVNSQVGVGSDPESFVPPDVLASLRQAVGARVHRVFAVHLEATSLGSSTTFAADVRKIVGAAHRLAEFAGTGKLPAS